MKIPVTVRVDVIQGHGAGQLLGKVVFEREGGDVVEESEPIPLAAGKSLNVSGVHAEYQLQGTLPTDTVTTPVPAKNGAGKPADKTNVPAALAGRR